jgi:hypothetical protein
MNGGLETLVSHAYGCSKGKNESEAYRVEMRKMCG